MLYLVSLSSFLNQPPLLLFLQKTFEVFAGTRIHFTPKENIYLVKSWKKCIKYQVGKEFILERQLAKSEVIFKNISCCPANLCWNLGVRFESVGLHPVIFRTETRSEMCHFCPKPEVYVISLLLLLVFGQFQDHTFTINIIFTLVSF